MDLRHVLDERGPSVLGVVTGKPIMIGGSLGREEATARGAHYCIRQAVQKQDLSDRRACASRYRASATSAFTSPGSWSRTEPRSWPCPTRAEASTTRTGSTSRPRSPTSRAGSLAGLRGVEEIRNEELVLLDVELLAPCALEQVITSENADKVRAKMICEGANGPVTPAADEILEDKGVLVLPDILANAGGVVVSYFEWVQGLQEYFWKEAEVNAKLNDITTRAFNETWVTPRARTRPCASPHTASPSSALPRRPPRAACIRSGRPLPRAGCHLCERARATLDGLREELGFELSEVDISGDPDLEKRYRELLPVVEIDGRSGLCLLRSGRRLPSQSERTNPALLGNRRME